MKVQHKFILWQFSFPYQKRWKFDLGAFKIETDQFFNIQFPKSADVQSDLDNLGRGLVKKGENALYVCSKILSIIYS